jgi:DNA topoisomerase-1
MATKKAATHKAQTGGKPLVIVESPAKARTLGKILGPGYRIEASIGHVRDLPANADEVPPAIKREKWSRLGIDIEHGFKPLYVVPRNKREQIRKLKEALEDASELYLATDEDREGESISWHLVQELKPKVAMHRLVFHEITPEAIREALSHPRSIDNDLVEAQETRRLVDRLYGYSVSPLLWKKIRPRLSAGRVQSVAVRLVVEREKERMRFQAAGYYDLVATFAVSDQVPLEAGLQSVGGRRIAAGKDFDPETGKLRPGKDQPLHLAEAEAEALAARLRGRPATVLGVDSKPYVERPYPPFTTSTLQQGRDASCASRRSGPCVPRSACTRTAASPTCAPTPPTSATRPSQRRAPTSPPATARSTCRRSRGSTAPRCATRRRRTRPSGRPGRASGTHASCRTRSARTNAASTT